MQSTTTWTTSKDDTTTEFDDSPEADAIRKCDEADRTGYIPDCTWVRKYSMTFTILLEFQFIQMTTECRLQWRAQCHHVRHGGLLTNPPPTTMIMPESNTTSIVWTTSATTIVEMDATTEFDDSPEAHAIRKCDEADRTGVFPECTWVREY